MNSDPFDPYAPLSVDDIVDAPKNREAYEQDWEDGIRQASKTVLADLAAQGVTGIAELQGRMTALEADDGAHDAPLQRTAHHYFTAYGTLPAGSKKQGGYEYLGCLSEAVHSIALARHATSSGEIEDASDTIMRYAQELGPDTHNALRRYLEDLADS